MEEGFLMREGVKMRFVDERDGGKLGFDNDRCIFSLIFFLKPNVSSNE